ncbi:uncharacterized protein Asalp_02570 [Aeromonas salmonicida subsp. pectinolytica 34mel]|uniref:Uncharacterized protein n=1 Tax=Aeromonas salmonicida subsp. pectinolytica 34mel TaxID=1324960 RepID=A0A2D1QBB6_AERSA|nr:uncharacterized protein Asalp_02570 [Aeromonas salmonicida subsp. pectinolytica 34mel]
MSFSRLPLHHQLDGYLALLCKVVARLKSTQAMGKYKV